MAIILMVGDMLQEICDDDIRLIRTWRNEENVRQVMFTGHIISEQEHLLWWKKTKVDNTQKWFIYYREGVRSGVVCFTDLDKDDISWGFYLANNIKSKRQQIDVLKGLEEEAIRYGFRKFKAKKLIAKVFEFNKSVIKMHQRFNFEIVAEEKRKKDGILHTVVIMELGIVSMDLPLTE